MSDQGEPEDLTGDDAASGSDLDVALLGGGVEAVRAAINRARAAAQAKGLRVGRPGSVPSTAEDRHASARRLVNARRRGGRYSGAAADDRDPQPFGALVRGLATTQGWSQDLAVGGLIGRWTEIVGDEVADHATPETFAEGVLTIRTTSTAWATQLRLLVPQLHTRLRAELGEGVVTTIAVIGPAAPSWRRGPRSVQGGRGPRDTYG